MLLSKGKREPEIYADGAMLESCRGVDVDALTLGPCDERVTARLGPGLQASSFKFTARSRDSTDIRGANLAFVYRVSNMVDFEHERRAHTCPHLKWVGGYESLTSKGRGHHGHLCCLAEFPPPFAEFIYPFLPWAAPEIHI